jgi:hypothetical protein
MVNEGVEIKGQVIFVLENVETGKKRVFKTTNIVTNDGDLYYAQSIVADTPTDDFDAAASGLRLGSDNTAPTKSDTDVTTFLSGSAIDLESGYPKVNDDDSDNTGSGTDIVSWKYYYDTSEGNVSNIIEGAIVDDRTTPTAALTHFLFAGSFSKTSSDTLKVFVNHTINGT